MIYTCPICQEQIPDDVIKYTQHGDKHIVDLLKYDHPEWVEEDGLCTKCYDYYKAEMDGSVFKDVPCVKRNRFIKKIFRPIKMFFIKADQKKEKI